MSDSGDLSVESLSEEETQKEDGNEEAMKGESEVGSRTFALSERKAKSSLWITDAWIYDDRQYYATSGYKSSEKVKRKQSFIFSFQDIFETLDSSTKGRQGDIIANGDTDWMCSDEENVQLARDCFRARNNNHSNKETTAPFKDHTPLSRNPYDRYPLNKTSAKRKLPSKSRKLLKPKSPSASSETTSSDPMTSSADDPRQWIVAEMAPQRASADNVSAIGYKSATMITMSEELATVSAAIASVLVFWSLLGAVVCLVLRFRRRKRRRRFKRHSVDDDVAHIDMLDEMIRTELARGRARMNNVSGQCPAAAAAATPSSPTYVNVPQPPPQFHYGFRTTTAFDFVQVLNSYNAISHDRNGQNFYEYVVAGGGRQLVARERVPPPPPRSLYNSPNVERVTCVRLSNARSLEVLQRTVRPKRVDFHRSKSFTEKAPNVVAAAAETTTSNHHLQQDKGREQQTRQLVSSATPKRNKRSTTTTEIGYISTQHRSNPYKHRPELSLVFSPTKTSFDKTRTPEHHPTESTFLKCRGQFLPYHTPRSVTSSSVPIGASSGHRCYDQGPVSRHRWFDGCRESPHGNFRCYACPIQRAGCGGGGNSRGSCGYYSSRPLRFPKMGQSCLVGEFQRNGNNPSANRSSSSGGGRDKTELVEC